jgi:hypothetical protein
MPSSPRRATPTSRAARTLARCALAWAAALCLAGTLHAADKTGFWLAPRSNALIDRQVAAEIGPRAGMIALRAAHAGPAPGYAFPDIAARLKQSAPHAPVLAYALVTRYQDQGRIEAYLLRGLDLGPPLVGKDAKMPLLDVTNPAMRRAVVERLVAERARLGVDGFAVDGATRTPATRPAQLARICQQKPGFCELYARSMDDIFGTLNAALGADGVLLYNGLRNFDPGMLEDQSRLLTLADAAAVEYFGMDPRIPLRSFRDDILAYLEAIPRLPKNKPLLFFGRGAWHYVDYAADFQWQRYLYAAFLLGRRPEDLFKYHASFQVPAHIGRAGGLDLYADWNIDLGPALGPYRAEGPLYVRDFSGGRVAVAPHDGRGGTLRLERAYYTPEGLPVSGQARLAAGEGLLLLHSQKVSVSHPASRRITAQQMAGWGWPNAERIGTAGAERLRITPVPGGLEYLHDVWLDAERSLVPFERLEIDTVLSGPGAAVLAVAEVDDPKGTHTQAVVAVEHGATAAGTVQLREAVQFRAPRRDVEQWPRVTVAHNPDAKQPIVLDGPRIFGSTGYRFRRWSHARFVAPAVIAEIRLDRRSAPLAVAEATRLPTAAPPAATTKKARTKPATGDLESRFRAADRNGDSALSRSELGQTSSFAGVRNNFDAVDADRDGRVTLQELRAWTKSRRAASGK